MRGPPPRFGDGPRPPLLRTLPVLHARMASSRKASHRYGRVLPIHGTGAGLAARAQQAPKSPRHSRERRRERPWSDVSARSPIFLTWKILTGTARAPPPTVRDAMRASVITEFPPQTSFLISGAYRQGRTYRRLVICPRCRGNGHLGKGLRPVAWGTCFRCGGSGVASVRCRKDGT